jgi:hypothetical protein
MQFDHKLAIQTWRVDFCRYFGWLFDQKPPIKVIRPEILNQPNAVARFKREVHLPSRHREAEERSVWCNSRTRFDASDANVRYWWVNRNQTYRQEIAGGYLWSPKRNANGARNPFYEFMREVTPRDLVFSFVDTRIAASGIVASYCYESPKPAEFGRVGLNWEAIGWRVRVNFVSLQNKIRPKDNIDLELRSWLPSPYSPLQESRLLRSRRENSVKADRLVHPQQELQGR